MNKASKNTAGKGIICAFFSAFMIHLLVPVSFAAGPCDQDLRDTNIADSFWTNADPFLFKDGVPDSAATLSFDIEIPEEEIYRKINQNAELSARFKIESQRRKISIQRASKKLGMSEKQFVAFVLRKGTVPESDQVLASTIYPKYIALLQPDEYLGLRQDQVQKDLDGLPIEVGKDGHKVEIRHLRYETSPSKYRQIIHEIHSKYIRPQSHFHLGIPGKQLNSRQLLAVGRALETRVVLRLALEDSQPNQPLSYTASYLYENTGEDLMQHVSRGVIKVQEDGFYSENPFHDIELRQWSTTEQAFEELEFALTLAKNPQNLKALDGINFSEISDPYTQNLPGALIYAGQALASSKDAIEIKLSQQLISLGKEMFASGGPTSKQRIAATKLISNGKVLERLDVKAFMN